MTFTETRKLTCVDSKRCNGGYEYIYENDKGARFIDRCISEDSSVDDIKRYLDDALFAIHIREPNYSINRVSHKKIVPLKPNEQGVYLFWHNGAQRFFKIGKCGPKSNARWISQHYITLPKNNDIDPDRPKSTLSQSLLNDEDFRKEFKIKNEKKSIRDYIENHFERINIIIYDESNKFLMNLIEALLHFKYEPMYEKG